MSLQTPTIDRPAARRESASTLFVPCAQCPLRRRPIFKDIDVASFDTIAKLKRGHLAFDPGQSIIAAGSESAELYTLFSGWAFRYKELEDGRRQILNIMLPGDLLGLQATMFGASQHGIDALTRVEACVFPRRGVWTMFASMPELAFDVTWLGAREVAHLDENLLSVGRRSAVERVGAFILGLFKRGKAIGLTNGDSMEWPLRQHHLADMLGLSLVHTSRSINALKRRGMFSFQGGRLRLLNPYALERLSLFFDADIQRRPLI